MADSWIAGQADHWLRLTAIGGDLMAFSTYYLGRDPWELRRRIYDFIAEHRKAVINLPMGHAKSTTITETVPIAFTCWNRDLRGLIGSEASKRATKSVKYCRDQLEFNPRILEDFGPFKGTPWRQDEFAVCGRSLDQVHPTLQSVGMDSRYLGGRVHYIILDDIVSRLNSQTFHQQSKTTDWVDTTIQSRLDPSARLPWPYGSVWALGNLFHPRDTLATIGERTAWALMRESAYTDAARTELLLPEFWTLEDLADRHAEMAISAFELAYMNNPGGLETNPFRPEWFRFWVDSPNRIPQKGGERFAVLPNRSELKILQGWDLARTKSARADYSVGATVGIHQRTARYFWLDFWRRQVEPWELVDAIVASYFAWRPERVAIESNAFQILVAQDVARAHPDLMRVVYATTTPSDRSKIDRITAGLQPSFARKAHYFPDREGMEEIIIELQHFPGAPNDDVPDAMELAIRDLDRTPLPQTRVGLAIGPVM